MFYELSFSLETHGSEELLHFMLLCQMDYDAINFSKGSLGLYCFILARTINTSLQSKSLQIFR